MAPPPKFSTPSPLVKYSQPLTIVLLLLCCLYLGLNRKVSENDFCDGLKYVLQEDSPINGGQSRTTNVITARALDLAKAERLYLRNIKTRNALMGSVDHPYPEAFANETAVRETLLTPTYPCPAAWRLGKWGDGGKWICAPDFFLTPESIVYSIGSAASVSFEDSVYSSFKIRPHTFDPYLDTVSRQIVRKDGALIFHRFGLGSSGMTKRNKRLKTLSEIMTELGHEFVDVLKIDCEGCEVEVMREFLKQYGRKPPIGQILIEIHSLDDPHTSSSLLLNLEKMGFRLFHVEDNVHCGKCYELAYIHESVITKIH